MTFDSMYLDKNIHKTLSHNAFDIYLILIHFYFKNGLFFNISADIILEFRGVKKIAQKGFNRSGYKRCVKEKISNFLKELVIANLISLEIKENFFYSIRMNKIYLNGEKIKLPKKILNYNSHKNSWHKDFAYFLSIYKQKKSKISTLQIQKILKEIKNDYSFLAPNEVRSRFEDVMDDLARDNIIQNWYYKNIDEEFLNCKNWLYWWQLLSVKIDFDILAQQPCFLNF